MNNQWQGGPIVLSTKPGLQIDYLQIIAPYSFAINLSAKPGFFPTMTGARPSAPSTKE